MQSILKKRQAFSLASLIGVWIIYAIIYGLFKSNGHVLAGGLVLSASIIVDVVMLTYAFWLWKNSESTAKYIFGLFALSFLCALGVNLFYHTLYDVLQLSRDQVSIYIISFYNVLYLGYLLLQLLAWTGALLTLKSSGKKAFSLYIPVAILVMVVLFIYISATSWHANLFSWIGLYDMLDKIFGLASFIAAVLCLATSKNKGFTYLALGFIVIMASGFFLDFKLLSQMYGTASFVENIWILGSMFMIYGLHSLRQSKEYNSIQAWLVPANSIRAQTAYWCFIICIVALIVFFAVAGFLNPKLFF